MSTGFSKDDGYTAACPECSARFRIKEALIGKARDLDLVLCDKCQAKKDRTIARSSPVRKSRN